VELCADYLDWATEHYQKNGCPTSELQNVRRAIRCLRTLYGELPACEFSPLKLKACRDQLIADGLCRSNCNRYVGIIVRILAHGVENELVPGGVYHALQAVKPLRRGRSAARETEPVMPVSDEAVKVTLPFLRPPYDTLVRLQAVTGMRPGEVRTMRPGEIDQRAEIWVYRPAAHKTVHHGRERAIALGPQAQALLQPWLTCLPTMLLFRNRRGAMVSRNSYEMAIHSACREAGVEPWAPNQLRHTFATMIRAKYGLEAAAILLGHSKSDTTLTYAERDLKVAIGIAAKLG
jgi:integrase